MLIVLLLFSRHHFGLEVKERLGMHSCAFEYSVRNSDLYDGVGGFSRTNADFIMFYQYLNNEDYGLRAVWS